MAGPLAPEEAGRWLSDLFEEHGRMVYGVCRVLLRDPQDAEDASQQTFLSAHRSLLAGTQPQDPAAWLGTIARNECRERIRARATVPLSLVGDPPASVQLEDVTGRREEIDALCAALAELPHQQREALVLREFYGLSYDEVRAALGVTDSAVESLIFRARKRLQKELRPARMASGALVLPIALHDSIAHAVPGFAGAHRVGIVGKLVGAPLAAKLVAATLAVTVAGVMGTTAVERHHSRARAVDPGVVAKAPSAPSPFTGAPDLASTPDDSDFRDAPAASHDGHKGHDDSQGGGPGSRGGEQGDQDEAAGAQEGDEDQSSATGEDDQGSVSSAGDVDNADTGNTGSDDSSGADGSANRPSDTDGDSGNSSADGNG